MKKTVWLVLWFPGSSDASDISKGSCTVEPVEEVIEAHRAILAGSSGNPGLVVGWSESHEEARKIGRQFMDLRDAPDPKAQ